MKDDPSNEEQEEEHEVVVTRESITEEDLLDSNDRFLIVVQRNSVSSVHAHILQNENSRISISRTLAVI